jgi:hypothetical protein
VRAHNYVRAGIHTPYSAYLASSPVNTATIPAKGRCTAYIEATNEKKQNAEQRKATRCNSNEKRPNNTRDIHRTSLQLNSTPLIFIMYVRHFRCAHHTPTPSLRHCRFFIRSSSSNTARESNSFPANLILNCGLLASSSSLPRQIAHIFVGNLKVAVA